MARGVEGIVDHYFRAYFIFGVAPDGMVDVADSDGDIVTHIAPDQAQRLITDREQLRQALIRALDTLPGAEEVYRVILAR